jgi:hypothetical protein
MNDNICLIWETEEGESLINEYNRLSIKFYYMLESIVAELSVEKAIGAVMELP